MARFPVPSSLAMALTLALVAGCGGDRSSQVEAPTEEASVPTADAATVDSSPDSPAATPAAAPPLTPGYYCYAATTSTVEAGLRLTVAESGEVLGDAGGVIADDDNAYYTSYRQFLQGTLDGEQLTLQITSWIEEDEQQTMAIWEANRDRVTDGNLVFTPIGCDSLDTSVFGDGDVAGAPDITGADLLEAANNINTRTVQFDPGTSGTVLSNSVVRGDRDVYRLRAQAGQVMALSITAMENNAAFDVISPTGEVLYLEGTFGQVYLPVAGEYQVVVGGTRGNATYELALSIR